MLTPRLEQIKDMLEKRDASYVLSKEQLELLKELQFLDKSTGAQKQILEWINETKTFAIAPAPGRCPACGRNF